MAENRRWLPPHFFLAALLASVALHTAWPVRPLIDSPFRWGGLIPVILGFWIASASSRQFSAYDTPIRPFEKSTTLVTDGWFRVSRNPMYLSMLLILVGVAMILGSEQAFIPVVLLGPVLHYRFVRKEEALLSAEFDTEYAEYCRRVRRWL